jgi:hypothetical protein
LIGLAASRSGKSGSFKAWSIARSLDPSGSGKVERKNLNKLLDSFISVRSRQRYIKEGIELGLLIPTKSKDYYRYINPGKVAQIYQAVNIVRAVRIQAADLFRSNWRSLLYAGYIAQLDPDQPISRAAIEEITGISRITQWNYEKETDQIKKFSNYQKLGKVKRKDKIKVVKISKEYPGHKIINGYLVRQLPNNYSSPGIEICRKGSLEKYRKTLAIFLKGQKDQKRVRIYFRKAKAAVKAARARGQEVFYFQGHNSKGNFNYWKAVETLTTVS